MIAQPSTDAERARLLQWAAERTGTREFLHPEVFAVVVRGKVLAAAVWHEYRRTDIRLSFAAATPRWATRDNITAILEWPWSLGINRITATTEKRNRRARRILEFAGFRLEGVLRDATEDLKPVCLYGLTRRDYANGLQRRTRTN